MNKIFFLFLMVPAILFGQKEKPKNYRKFDERLIHFGFMLGGNTSSFRLIQNPNTFADYGLKSLQVKSSIGGQVGIVSTMKLGHPVVRLRIIPTLSFQEKIVNYQFADPDPNEEDIFNEERINMTSIDIPLMLQFRTKRMNNFAAYCLLGGQYSVDLQSQQDASQDFLDPFLKLKKHDFQAQLGGGIEFFAPFFKFGIEIKYSHGVINSYVPDNTFISEPINKTYNRVWWFSIIFEG